MNKIIEEARELGISLVGWVEVTERSIAKMTGDCSVVEIQTEPDGQWGAYVNLYDENSLRKTFPDIIDAANKHAEFHGGWAPAPIGMGLSEWLTEAIAEVDKLWDKAYNDDLKGGYSSYHSGEKDAYDKCLDILKRFQPAPPEVKG